MADELQRTQVELRRLTFVLWCFFGSLCGAGIGYVIWTALQALDIAPR